jgi:hypothetical protein
MAEELWTTDDVARFLGVESVTVRAYLARGKMPAPDQKYGVTNLWKPTTIKKWAKSRPRSGEGTQT